jgi:hypothetical protein
MNCSLYCQCHQCATCAGTVPNDSAGRCSEHDEAGPAGAAADLERGCAFIGRHASRGAASPAGGGLSPPILKGEVKTTTTEEYLIKSTGFRSDATHHTNPRQTEEA